MSLNNFHTNNYIGRTRPIYPSQQDRMNTYGLALNQPRDWDIPNRVPVPRVRPADNTNTYMQWLKDMTNTEFRSNGLSHYYVPMSSAATRTLHGDDVESLLLYNRNGKWPSGGRGMFSRYFRAVPY